MWYIPSQQWAKYTAKHFQYKGDLQPLLAEALTYLNTYIAPHNFVSISVFEDDHPCPNNHYHVVIYHKGDGVTPITKPADIQGDIYQMHQFESEGWETVMRKTEDYLLEGGAEFKH
jgi:hypothetical protein